MTSTSVPRASGTETQKRRRMSRYSSLGPSSRVATRGSSAMPQIGQLPGASRTISGCIGQVHSVLVARGAGITVSRAMPHFGQAPGRSLSTSGCMGQVHFVTPGEASAGAALGCGAWPAPAGWS